MVRVSKRKARNVEVPTLEQDAAERKRLLNVLAQRRYRERKRQHYKEMESKINGKSPARSSNTDSREGEEVAVPDTSEPTMDNCLNLNQDFELALFSATGLDDWDTSVLFPTLSNNPVNDVSGTSVSTPSYSSGSAFNSSLSSTDSLDFPDEAFLPILELNILKAGVAIAKRLDVESIIWDLTSLSPFNHATNLDFDHLPANLRPTVMQLTIPHHPFLDILPWPEVRDKLILVFSQPEELRPPTARSPTAMIGFVYDIEDSAEGIRVTGDDPYTSDNWELGQKVFSKWWWAFTTEIIDHSNNVREARGASALTGTILGEVS